MLHPKIIEVSTDKVTSHAYLLVHFWKTKVARSRSDPPFLIEDFLMQLRPTGERVVTNAKGWLKRLDNGEFVDPATLQPDIPEPEWEREVFNHNLPAEIRDNIRRYIVEAEKLSYRGDNSSATASGGEFFAKGRLVRPKNRPITAIQRDSSDPHGVLAKPEVVALRGKDIDLVVRP